MYHNGVSHKTEKNDFDGVGRLLRWLSYIPKHKGHLLPIIPSRDPIDREYSQTTSTKLSDLFTPFPIVIGTLALPFCKHIS